MSNEERARLYYHRLPDFARKEAKLEFLSNNSLSSVDWQRLVPNTKHTWRRTDTEDEFADYLPIGSKEAKRAKAETIFKTYSGGIKTNRDVYVYDYQFNTLLKRMKQFVDDYNNQVDKYKRQNPKPDIDDFVDVSNVKWGESLKDNLRRGNYANYSAQKIRKAIFRPFSTKFLFFDSLLNERIYLQSAFFPDEPSESENQMIWYKVGVDWPQYALMVNKIPDLMPQSGSQCFPFYTYDEDGNNRRENITDYALDQFRSHYNDPAISKWDIFYYVYGLLHHPGYRERYALDLKRNLPRIPFAPTFSTPSPGPFPEASGKGSSLSANTAQVFDHPPIAMGGPRGVYSEKGGGFRAFSEAGIQLADLHLNYESADRFELDWQSTRKPVSYRVEKMLPKGKVDSSEGNYKVYSTLKYNDTLTLHGIPERAFAYRLGNRSALDWIVDQYRVKTDKRSGITHDPNGYSDDAQYILKLIERVITVSLRTVDIVEDLAMLPFRPDSPAD